MITGASSAGPAPGPCPPARRPVSALRPVRSVCTIHPRGLPRIQQPQQQPSHQLPHLLHVLPHRGQRWVRPGRRLQIVVADHCHLVRHPPPAGAERAQRAARHQVGADEDGVQVRYGIEEPAHGPLTAQRREAAVRDQPRVRLRCAERIAVAVEPVHRGCLVERSGDHGDPAAAAAEEVAYGLAGAVAVVGVDVQRPGVAVGARPAGPAAVDGGQPGALGHARQRVVAVQREHQRAVDMPGRQIAADAAVVGGPLDEHQQELGVGRGQFAADAPQLASEERVAEDPGLGLGDDHRDRSRAAGDQGAGRAVRYVPQRGDRLVNPFADRGPYARTAVDHAGHRGAGDPGERGDRLQRRARPRTVRIGHPPLLSTSLHFSNSFFPAMT
ncbi:hypothetical protein SAMN05428945_3843 [Streptomyces sp. 2224.1]|nr:hypothetical protein SAMN05428945_3843 [Streptomyces sp. 2224.1]